jgi:hypothetical protein
MQKYLNIVSKPIFVKLLKGLILVLVLAYIYRKLKFYAATQLFDMAVAAVSDKLLLFLLPLGFVFLNWGLEALKWQKAASQVERISYKTAVMGVLSGLNIGLLLPQALGDYAGRVWHLKSAQRTDALSSVFICHFSQFLVTCMGGLLALIICYAHGYYIVGFQAVMWLSMIVFLLIIAVALVFKNQISSFARQHHWLGKYYHFLKTALEINPKLLLEIVLYSILRYMCFLGQFVFILFLFGVNMHFLMAMVAIMLVFLVKSLIPSFNFLADLGVREFSALTVFSLLHIQGQDLAVLSASLLVWLINILLPTVLGMFTILSLKISATDG